MAIREILTAPDPRLRQISKPVAQVDDALRALMDDMLDTMYDAPGIGLAAIQVGVPLRVVVMDLAQDDEEPAPKYFVNPVILNPSEETKPYEEGVCRFLNFQRKSNVRRAVLLSIWITMACRKDWKRKGWKRFVSSTKSIILKASFSLIICLA